MRIWLALLILCPGLVQIASATPSDVDASNLAVADRHIVPAYQRLSARAAHLDGIAKSACGEGVLDLPNLQQAYSDAFLAWQGVQHIRFGPIQVLNRSYRFQLWPDKRGSVGKHLRKLLAGADQAKLDSETFTAGSVAVQGFSALERLLYDEFAETKPDNVTWRCDVVRAITHNLMQMSSALVGEWRDGSDAHRLFLADASRGNSYYESADEVSGNLLNSLHTQLELIVTQKLGRPLGKGPDKVFRKRAEAWRSGQSLAAIRENLSAGQALYETGFAPRLKDADMRGELGQQFRASLQTLAVIDGSLSDALTTPEGYRQLVQLRQQVSVLKGLVAGGLAAQLGLQLGFNSLDGD